MSENQRAISSKSAVRGSKVMSPTSAGGKSLSKSAAPRSRSRSGKSGTFITKGPALSERTGFLVERLGGGTKVANLLGVSKSQPTRWRNGQEQPSPAKAREIVDLDHVVARASLLWEPEVVQAWLEGSNAYLQGARPIDVLQVRGVSEVLAALEAETQLAFG
jgi:DNA-binding transcriptional regulator YdaS (Cro superfamily)